MDYLIIIEQTEDGYSAYVPDLPGCISIGKDKAEVEKNIREAIIFHIEGMKEDGEEIPTAKSDAYKINIPSVA
ncbi:type II toxin-antitoxin system HicB family antitoxin [Marivirga sp.]|uniref:type II toxin-antitoxin system HicB family antitoxin n=1 Tax=Marivirga sp. TaxID=2018662 RepID=UPI002D80E4E1|nr:type II toxin-antitoxin system HicB family antitoxin [Marivirga sp.]HET8858705.1 type II toxin-antitoxin system HicB family antitoxin [Marivirga sp.]